MDKNVSNLSKAENQLFDYIIHVDGLEIEANKKMLAASSSYFDAIFSNNFLESSENEIRLSSVSAEGLCQIHNYIHKSQMFLTCHNVYDVLETASYLMIPELIEHCFQYLEKKRNFLNCVDVLGMAEIFYNGEVIQRTIKFISNNLSQVEKAGELNKLTAQQWKSLLNSKFMVDCRESDVLKIFTRWLLTCHELGENPMGISKLFNYEDIPSSDLWEVLDILSTFSGQYVDEDSKKALIREFITQVSKAIRSQKNGINIRLQNHVLNPRGMEPVLLKITWKGEIYFSPLTDNNMWKLLAKIPSSLSSLKPEYKYAHRFVCCLCNNELYVMKLFSAIKTQQIVQQECHVYNPNTEKWRKVDTPRVSSSNFSMTAVEGTLYLIDGLNGQCWRFNRNSNKWCYDQLMPIYANGHSSISYEDKYSGERKLFVSGGFGVDGWPTRRMVCYDFVKRTWQICASLMRPRYGHVMCVIGKYIYSCGGQTMDNGILKYRYHDTIDRYDIKNDFWETINIVPNVLLSEANVTEVGGKITFMRGDSVFPGEVFNPSANSWTSLNDKRINQFYESNVYSTIYLPIHRDSGVIY